MKTKFIALLLCAFSIPAIARAQDHEHQKVHELENTIAELRAEIAWLKSDSGSLPLEEISAQGSVVPGLPIPVVDGSGSANTVPNLDGAPGYQQEPIDQVVTQPAPSVGVPLPSGVSTIPPTITRRVIVVGPSRGYGYGGYSTCPGGTCYGNGYRPPYAGYQMYRYDIYRY